MLFFTYLSTRPKRSKRLQQIWTWTFAGEWTFCLKKWVEMVQYKGCQKRPVIFISIALQRHTIRLVRYCLQENDSIILIIGMSKSPVFLRHRLLGSVQVKKRFNFCLYYWKSTRKNKSRLEKKILFLINGEYSFWLWENSFKFRYVFEGACI